ncbi:LamG-like jellyroll fold domain-containing protein [Niabella ginsengisoli]|uniref:Alkaline phosphatase family protein n=1 Tax=Niabella ginsengisoli TaxID=522298 RepID=A0ABS9SIX1_9BACT|nr:LamG-like jellyroll fold domain-containing protein [Niabella ginsengisoli]MCH5598270.1 alkaline phosphatase family protein [Niabella ginsengisoli]
MNILKFSLRNVCVVLPIAILFFQACNKPVILDREAGEEETVISLKKKKVLVIALDGVVGASVEEMNLPTINKMQENSVSSFYGLIDTISNAGTTWADLLTGTRLNKHNVKTENFSAGNFTQYPSFLKRLKDQNNQIRSIAITTLPLLATGVFGTEVEKHIHLADKDQAAKDSAVNRLKTDDLDLLLVDFSIANREGKTYGFGTSVSQYRQALQTIDDYIDELVYTVEHRDAYANEDWLIVVTSTHGGKPDGTYGGNGPLDRNVFSLYYNPDQKKTVVPRPLFNIPYDGNFIRFNVQNGAQLHAYVNNPAYNFGTSQNFTVEMRIKSDNTTSDDPPLISNKNWASGGNPGWLIFKQGNHTRINFATNVSGSRLDFNGPVFTDNKWHMVSVSFDRKGLISVYQDGILFHRAI